MIKSSNLLLMDALLLYKENPNQELRNRIAELVIPIAKKVVRTYSDNLKDDILQDIMEEMLKTSRFLAYDPKKGSPEVFIKRCLHNLAINYFNKDKRSVKQNVYIADLAGEEQISIEWSGIPDDGKAVLKVQDEYPFLEKSALASVLRYAEQGVKARFYFNPKAQEVALEVIQECLKYGVNFNSLELLTYISNKYGITRQKAKHLRNLALFFVRKAVLQMGMAPDNSELVQILDSYFSNNPFTELCHLLGWDTAKQFVLIFGGTTVKVPHMHELKKAVIDFEIYKSLKGKSRLKKQKILPVLASKFKMTERQIVKVYKKIRNRYKLAKS